MFASWKRCVQMKGEREVQGWYGTSCRRASEEDPVLIFRSSTGMESSVHIFFLFIFRIFFQTWRFLVFLEKKMKKSNPEKKDGKLKMAILVSQWCAKIRAEYGYQTTRREQRYET